MLEFENNDRRIKHCALLLEKSLDDIADYRLPDGYSFVFYKSGERDGRIEIEKKRKGIFGLRRRC